MADENAVPATDVNSQSASAASSPAPVENTQSNPPGGETPAGDSGSDQRIPYPRFNQVIQERNQERERREAVENRLRDMESRLMGERPNTQGHSYVEAEVQRLKTQLQLPEETARAFVQSQSNIAKAERAEVEQRLRVYEVNEWSRSLESKYKDYRDLVPAMEKAFANLSDRDRSMVASSPFQLESFYHYVKSQAGPVADKNAFEAGAKAAYDNQQIKKALSSAPGASTQPKAPITREAIKNMSVKEYKDRLPEINEALAKGLIK